MRDTGRWRVIRGSVCVCDVNTQRENQSKRIESEERQGGRESEREKKKEEFEFYSVCSPV